MTNNQIELMLNAMSNQWKLSRAESQMTLGDMISKLESMNGDDEIFGLGEMHSYRGYYSDLSFEPSTMSEKVSDLLERCRGAMGKTFEGYKGGDFVMGKLTPLWVAYYGCTGDRIMDILVDGTIVTEPENE